LTGIPGKSFRRSPGTELIWEGAGEEGGVFGGLYPETKHLHSCQSILLSILFMNVLKMLKISQPVTFFPHPPLYQLEASCRNLVSSWL